MGSCAPRRRYGSSSWWTTPGLAATSAPHRYLLAAATCELDNPNRALELLEEAAKLDDHEAGPSYSVSFATAQALAALARSDEAAAAYQRALQLAPAEHRAFTQHEAAFAMIESDRLDQAEHLLSEVVTDPSYSYRGEALADLADVYLRRGDLDGAANLAQQALNSAPPRPPASRSAALRSSTSG